MELTKFIEPCEKESGIYRGTQGGYYVTFDGYSGSYKVNNGIRGFSTNMIIVVFDSENVYVTDEKRMQPSQQLYWSIEEREIFKDVPTWLYNQTIGIPNVESNIVERFLVELRWNQSSITYSMVDGDVNGGKAHTQFLSDAEYFSTPIEAKKRMLDFFSSNIYSNAVINILKVYVTKDS